jgi:hypothetical protein
VTEQDRYERLVATVYVDGDNVNAWLVAQGHAWAYRAYLDDENLIGVEEDARRARRGLWSFPIPLRRGTGGNARGSLSGSSTTVTNLSRPARTPSDHSFSAAQRDTAPTCRAATRTWRRLIRCRLSYRATRLVSRLVNDRVDGMHDAAHCIRDDLYVGG